MSREILHQQQLAPRATATTKGILQRTSVHREVTSDGALMEKGAGRAVPDEMNYQSFCQLPLSYVSPSGISTNNESLSGTLLQRNIRRGQSLSCISYMQFPKRSSHSSSYNLGNERIFDIKASNRTPKTKSAKKILPTGTEWVVQRMEVVDGENDEEGEFTGFADNEDETPLVTPKKAVKLIIEMFKEDAKSDNNYSVAALENGDLIITKVNGVTTKTAVLDTIATKIEEKKIAVGRDIFLAQKYNNALGSNHAEMILLAAARVLGEKISYMACTGPNCPYCAQMLKDEGVKSANAGQDGRSQQGWAHPFKNIFWGTQVSNESVTKQVADLARVNKGMDPSIGRPTIQESQGRCIKWL